MHPSLEVKIFADDIRIYCAYSSSNQNLIHEQISLSIRSMMKWSSKWKIPVNLEKTIHLHLGPYPAPSYSFNEITIRQEDIVRDLCVVIDTSLKFYKHLEATVRKAMASLFTILRSVQCNDAKILVRLYNTHVLPQLEYSSTVWSPCVKKYILSLEKVQKAFTKIVFYRAFPNENYPQSLPSYRDRLQILGMKSLKYRRVVKDLTFCFRIIRMEIKLSASKYWIFKPCRGRTAGIAIQHRKLNHQFNKLAFHSFFMRTTRWLN